MKRWLVIWMLALLPWQARAATEELVQVSARKENDHVVLTAHFAVPGSRDLAWEVLTDFEHMTRFLPYMSESLVLSRSNNFLRIQQKGSIPVAFFQMNYHSIRDIELLPNYEIHSSTSGGDSGLTRSVTRLQSVNNQTELDYRADWWPTSQMIAGFGMDSIRELVMRQFTAMRQEILRRQQLKK